jgi:D-alanyl-D-alanine carboxypeptidase
MSGVTRALPLVLTLVLAGCTASAGGGGRASDPSSTPVVTATMSSSVTGMGIEPAERWAIHAIGPALRDELTGRNWHAGCPVALDDLREVTVRYVDFRGDVRSGPLIVARSVADDVLWVFRRLFRHGFPIKHVALPGKWHPTRPSDFLTTRSVTGAFNCRPVTDGTSLSQHSYGWAIDINPLQNPYVRGDGSVLRRAAKAYLDRSQDLPGMIHPGDVVVRSFARIGWGWGGDWHTVKDYMHFSLTGG